MLKLPTYFWVWVIWFLVSHGVCFTTLGIAASSTDRHVYNFSVFLTVCFSVFIAQSSLSRLLSAWNMPCEIQEDSLCCSLIPLAGNIIFSHFLLPLSAHALCVQASKGSGRIVRYQSIETLPQYNPEPWQRSGDTYAAKTGISPLYSNL